MRSVSVIIPTYNRSRLLSEAIESVIRQDVTDCELEVIVVDDGSTDNTADVVKSFGPRVRYIYQKNRGAGVARNHGIEVARGEWIAFLDSDDRWLPHKLSLQFRMLEAFREYRAVHTNFYTFSEQRIIIENGLGYWLECFNGKASMKWLDIYTQEYDARRVLSATGPKVHTPVTVYGGNLFGPLLKAPCAACWTLLVAREQLTPEVRFAESYPTWEDYWFFCRLSEACDLLFLDTPTAENRAHGGPRLTHARRYQTLECYLDICRKIYHPSKSPNRPPTETILRAERNARTTLFKEYLKEGYLSKARAMIHRGHVTEEFAVSPVFYLYRAASFLPFNVTQKLVAIKRATFGE